MGRILAIAFTAVFAENTIFYRALGTSTLTIVSRSRKNLLGFGLGVTYITAVMSLLTFFLNKALQLDENSYIYAPMVYIIILGTVYIITLLCLWRFAPRAFGKMKKYIHISAFNCAVLGALMLASERCESALEYFVYGFGTGLGFMLAVYLTSIVYERLYSEKTPYSFRGYPLLLIYIGILSMSFWGLSGYTLNF